MDRKARILRKILLVQLRQLGDIILTTPCIREVKKAWPDAEVSFLSHPMGRLVLEGNPWLDQLYTYPVDDFFGELKLVRHLRKQKFDIVLDFMSNPRSALYSLLAGRGQRWAFDTRRRAAYNHVVPRSRESDYIVREKFKLLDALGIKAQDETTMIPWGEEHLEPLRQCPGLGNEPIRVVISPTHRRSPRRWPEERYAALADLLVEHWGAKVVFAWGPGESDVVDRVQAMCKKPTLKAPKTSFRELAAFIGNCDLFVGNSNGPSHVAVTVGTPSLQLHGPTQASAWCPRNELHRAIQGADESMLPIDLDSVWDEIEALKPVVAKKAQNRVRNGVRMSWTSP